MWSEVHGDFSLGGRFGKPAPAIATLGPDLREEISVSVAAEYQPGILRRLAGGVVAGIDQLHGVVIQSPNYHCAALADARDRVRSGRHQGTVYDEVKRNVDFDLCGLSECRSGRQQQTQHANES